MKVAPPAPGGALFSGAAERAYLVLGCLIGAAGGPLQAASRSLLIRLAPKDRIAQYFGLFALTGKVTSFIGPLLIGTITAVTASQKAGMATLVLFFVAGLALLMRVRRRSEIVVADPSRCAALHPGYGCCRAFRAAQTEPGMATRARASHARDDEAFNA